jgi:phosphatidylinositol phospholipase C beta
MLSTLSDKRISPCVEVEMCGLPVDTVKSKNWQGKTGALGKAGTYPYRTSVASNNGLNPVWNEKPFVFDKVVFLQIRLAFMKNYCKIMQIVFPELALLRLIVYDDPQLNKPLAHRILPVWGLRPGYRHIVLRNAANQPLGLATLFVKITVRDFVPELHQGK